MTSPPSSYDVVVVGAGVIGLASAWRLADSGLRVGLADPAPAAAATHAAAGMLAPVSEVTYGETALLHLAMESLRRYPAFVTALETATGMTVGLRREGTLIVATDAGDRSELEALHAFQISLGLTATMLTSREARSLEPLLTPDVRCGLLVASDHSVDNRRLAAALLAAATAGGVDLHRRRAARINRDADGVCGVELDNGETLAARRVVVAAGPWSGQIDGLPDEARPQVRPVKGEIVRLRAHPPLPLPSHSVRALVNGREVYLVPRADGELVVGATVQDVGFDVTVRAGAIRELLRDARAAVPAIDELELVETLAGLRPGSPDNTPVVGTTTLPGLILATGHYRNGILLTPITADLVRGLVTGAADAVERELADAVSPYRFTEAGTTA